MWPSSSRAAASARRCSTSQVTAADASELWTLQTSIFPENRASIALHHRAGYRNLAVRERIARLDGVWRDTVLMERRS
jgi:L-amino acid N-acyltransferase YncA